MSVQIDPQMALAFSEAFKLIAEGDKAVGTTHSGITLHGPGGIFSTFGLDRDIINASVQPRGLAAELPLEPSIDTDPRFASLTGVTESYGSQPTNACSDAPNAYMKGCNLTARFGRIRFDTNTIEFDEVIKRYNRGDFMDLRFLGSMLHNQSLSSGEIPSDLNENEMLNVVTLAEMLVVGVQFSREINTQLWQGNISLPNQFAGLDYQIATGQRDADNINVLCTALDSTVLDYGYTNVSAVAKDVVGQLSSLMYGLEYNAETMGLDPTEFVVVMRPSLWFELSAIWPCRFYSDNCQSSAGTDISVINDSTNTDLRTRMRNDKIIPINGNEYRVVTDQGIYEHTAATAPTYLSSGEFASNIYIVPLTIMGGFPVTTRQYLNYQTPVASANTAPFANYRSDFWSDNGIFSWAYDGQFWCYKLGAKSEQRVILRTPQLAGRIDNVGYIPAQHLRDWNTDSDYFHDGGVSSRPESRSSYAVWGTGAAGLIPSLT